MGGRAQGDGDLEAAQGQDLTALAPAAGDAGTRLHF